MKQVSDPFQRNSPFSVQNWNQFHKTNETNSELVSLTYIHKVQLLRLQNEILRAISQCNTKQRQIKLGINHKQDSFTTDFNASTLRHYHTKCDYDNKND